MQKTQKTQMRSFLQNQETEKVGFCVITKIQLTIKIQTCSAPLNERLNLSFVKNNYVEGENLARNGRKTAICQSQIMVISLQIKFQFYIELGIKMSTKGTFYKLLTWTQEHTKAIAKIFAKNLFEWSRSYPTF